MAFMISKWHGVPSTEESGWKQHRELLKAYKGHPLYRGRYLVLIKQKNGMYKGLFVNYLFERKPKVKGAKAISQID